MPYYTKKGSIEIQRSKIEQFLMFLKEFIKRNTRKVITVIISVVLIFSVSLAVYILYSSSSEKELVKFEIIIEKYRSEPLNQEVKNNTIAELRNLISETKFGFVHDVSYYYLGNILFNENKFNEAYDAFSMFIKKSSSKDVFIPIAVNKSALCLEEMGQIDNAIDMLNKFDEKYTDSIVSDQINYNIARLYSIKNNQIKAKEYYSNVISKYPRSVYAERSKERLCLLSIAK